MLLAFLLTQVASQLDTQIGVAIEAGHRQLRRTRDPLRRAVTKQHPDSPKRINGTVAAIIAYDRAMWHASERPPLEPMVAYI